MACAKTSLLNVKLLNVNKAIVRNIIMSAQRRAQESLDKIMETNPYFDKYADKIAKLQQTSPKEFLERVDKVTNPIKEGKSQARSYSELLHPKAPREQVEAEIPHKKLSDIMKIELIKDKTAEEISKIWVEYHKTKDVLAATLTVKQFNNLMEKAKNHPIFLLPLPRSEGFEFILFQFANNTVHFTPLLAYQIHAENAPECVNIVHYTEMSDKGIVLMRGEYDTKVLTAQEAQCLVNQMQMFYCIQDEAKQQLLETFTKKPDEFKHMDLIKEVENIQLV